MDNTWATSSFSGGNGCLSARRAAVIQVRDSQDPAPVLTFAPIRWRQFVDAVKSGEIRA